MPDRRTRRIARLLVSALLALVLVLVGVTLVLRLTNPRPRGELGWLRVQPMPGARGEVASAMAGERLVVAGGLYGVGRTTAAVDVFDVLQRQWTIAPPLPAGRNHAAAAALGDWVYVAGGADGVRMNPRAEVWRAHAGGKWEPVAPMPEGRTGHAMVAFGSRLYVFGGVGRSNRTLIYEPGRGWSAGAPLPAGRNHLRAVVWGHEIWVIGGRTSHLLSRIDVYDAAANTWRRGPDLPKPMSAMAVGVLNDDLQVVGGENPALVGGRVLADHFVLRGGGKIWETRASQALPVHGAGFGAYQGVLYVAGGATRPGALSVLSWTNVTQLYSSLPQRQV